MEGQPRALQKVALEAYLIGRRETTVEEAEEDLGFDHPDLTESWFDELVERDIADVGNDEYCWVGVEEESEEEVEEDSGAEEYYLDGEDDDDE